VSKCSDCSIIEKIITDMILYRKTYSKEATKPPILPHAKPKKIKPT